MPQVIIVNPIINSPYVEPTRHFYFDEDGITDRVVDSRRISSYFVPIPKPKKKGKQLEPSDPAQPRSVTPPVKSNGSACCLIMSWIRRCGGNLHSAGRSGSKP